MIWLPLLLEAEPSTKADTLSIVPHCPAANSGGEIVVCGHSDLRDSQRLEKLDPRFEPPRLPGGRFQLRLSDRWTLEGGGPKGSVGISLRMKF